MDLYIEKERSSKVFIRLRVVTLGTPPRGIFPTNKIQIYTSITTKRGAGVGLTLSI